MHWSCAPINLVEKITRTVKQYSDLKTSSIPLQCLEAQLSSLSLVAVLLILFVCHVHSDSQLLTLIYNIDWNRSPNKKFAMMTSSNGTIFGVTGPLCGEFTGHRRPVIRSFDVVFDLCLNKRLSKQPWGWWFERPSCSLWCRCTGLGKKLYRIWHVPMWLLLFL